MAKMKFELSDELMQKLQRLQGEELDRICKKALTAAGEIVLKETKSQLKSVIGTNPQTKYDKKHGSRSTGELVESLGLSPPELNNNGVFDIKVGFGEPRKHKTGQKEQTNAMIANVLENGRHGSPPRPFLKKAKAKSQKAALAEMERVITMEIEKL